MTLQCIRIEKPCVLKTPNEFNIRDSRYFKQMIYTCIRTSILYILGRSQSNMSVIGMMNLVIGISN